MKKTQQETLRIMFDHKERRVILGLDPTVGWTEPPGIRKTMIPLDSRLRGNDSLGRT